MKWDDDSEQWDEEADLRDAIRYARGSKLLKIPPGWRDVLPTSIPPAPWAHRCFGCQILIQSNSSINRLLVSSQESAWLLKACPSTLSCARIELHAGKPGAGSVFKWRVGYAIKSYGMEKSKSAGIEIFVYGISPFQNLSNYGGFQTLIWRFPEIGVPQNHPF